MDRPIVLRLGFSKEELSRYHYERRMDIRLFGIAVENVRKDGTREVLDPTAIRVYKEDKIGKSELL